MKEPAQVEPWQMVLLHEELRELLQEQLLHVVHLEQPYVQLEPDHLEEEEEHLKMAAMLSKPLAEEALYFLYPPAPAFGGDLGHGLPVCQPTTPSFFCPCFFLPP